MKITTLLTATLMLAGLGLSACAPTPKPVAAAKTTNPAEASY